MQNVILAKLNHDNYATINNNNQQAFTKNNLNNQNTASASDGLFDEQIKDKKIEKYHKTLFNTKTKTITAFDNITPTYIDYSTDPVVAAMSVDPAFKISAYLSPFAAFGDNPLYYVDREGETLRVAGDEMARQQAQAALQKLTNDHVEVQKDGLVVITMGGENTGKKLVFGTKLIAAISTNKNTTYYF